jgi:hypothetical protein
MASADLDDNVVEADLFSLLTSYSSGYFVAAFFFIIIIRYAPSILLTQLAGNAQVNIPGAPNLDIALLYD